MAGKQNKTNNIYINGKQAGNTISDLKKRSRELNREINQMAPGTKRYKKAVGELGGVKKQLRDHRNEIKKVEGSYKKVRGSMGMIKNMVGGFLGAGAIMGAVRGIVNGIGNWIQTNAQLSASLSSLKAITGASTQDVKFYKEEAIRLGAATTQSATQVVDAMKLIGSAKPDLLSNKEALAGVTEETIRLAEAGQINMQASADSLTGSLNQWGEGADQAARFTNVLAAGSKEGAANIEQLGQSIDKSGAVMAGYNVSIEQGVGLLETLGEKNLKGAEAGTKLRNVLLNMQGVDALPPKALAQLEKYGVNTEIVADKTQPLNTRLAEMAKISGDATAIMEVFGRENFVAAEAVLNNTDKVAKYTEAVTGTNVAMEQQKENNDNLQGDMKKLSSAWEGFILTVGSGEGILRSLVQTLTSVVTWVTDLWSALSEGDTRQIGQQFLKLADSMWVFGGAIGEAIKHEIRMNELTDEVIDKIEGKTRSFNILSMSLQENNDKLKQANLTEEETNAIKEDSQKIIDKLNKKFPELTKNIDLQNASNEELIEIQNQAADAILAGAIAEAKAAEQKRLINAITEESIALRRQEKKEADRWAVTNFFADIFADDAEDMEENIKRHQSNLMDLDEDFKHVEQTVKDLDLSFVVDFETANDMIEKQEKRIEKFQEFVKKAEESGNKQLAKGFQARLDAEIEVLNAAQKKKQDIKDEEFKEQEEAEKKAAEKAAELAEKEAEKARKAREKELEKLRDRLEDLAEFEKQVNLEKNREIALANKEGLEKELQEQKFAIEDKYKKEIESAKELAKEKGEIGAQAAERLATLEALKEEELAQLKADIQERQREEQKQEEEEAAKERAEAQIRIEDATWNTKRTILEMKLSELGAHEVEERQRILDEIERLEVEKAQRDLERRIEELRIQYDNGEISKIEFNTRMRELETEHQQQLTDIHRQSEDEREKITEERINKTINGAQTAVNVWTELAKAGHALEMNQINQEKDERIAALDEALTKKVINEKQYDEKLAEIERDADDRRKKLELQQFKRDKAISLVQVAIDTAKAIVKASPNVPLQIAAAATGAAQAAVIASQEPPQFKDGGFTTVTGAEDGKTYNAKITGKAKPGMLNGGPQLVLANEEGPEYFVPNPMLSDPEVIDHVRAIENIRVRQFAEGGATAQLPDSPQRIEVAGNNEETQKMMMNYMKQNMMIQRQLLEVLRDGINVNIGDQDIDDLFQRQEELENIRA